MSEHKKILRGWMIQQRDADGLVPEAFFSAKHGGFVGEMQGTLFPSMQAAEAYANEYGHKIGTNVEIVENGF